MVRSSEDAWRTRSDSEDISVASGIPCKVRATGWREKSRWPIAVPTNDPVLKYFKKMDLYNHLMRISVFSSGNYRCWTWSTLFVVHLQPHCWQVLWLLEIESLCLGGENSWQVGRCLIGDRRCSIDRLRQLQANRRGQIAAWAPRVIYAEHYCISECSYHYRLYLVSCENP